MLRYAVVGFVCLLAACSASKHDNSDLGFITEIGVDGLPRLVAVQKKTPSGNAAAQVASPQSNTDTSKPVLSDDPTQSEVNVPASNSYNASVFASDDEFIESSELEASNFNPDNKRKFAWVPDGSGVSRPFYYEDGDGANLHEYNKQETHVQTVYEPTLLAPNQWPEGLADKTFDLTAIDVLSFNTAYKLGACSTTQCESVVLKLPDGLQGYIRLRSYLSQLSCTRCVQIPQIAIVDGEGKVQRVYASEPLGFRAESWRTFASFYSDITVDAKTDKGMVLIPSQERQFSFLNKNYKNVAVGEVSIKRI